MGIFNEFHRKEKPVFTGITRGIGGFGFGAATGGAGGGVVIPNIEASGGIIHEWTEPGPGVKYRAHIFINPGSFDVSSIPGPHPGTMDYLVVGGGGGGTGNNGAGGGGGGVYTGSQTIAALTYPVTTGIGGKGSWGGNTNPAGNGYQGQNSSFVDPSGPTTRTAGGGGYASTFTVGGGGGGSSPGGSGGGAADNDGPVSGGAGNGDAGAQNGGDGGGMPGSGPRGLGGGGGGAGGSPANNDFTSPYPVAVDGGPGYQSTILGPILPAPRSYWGAGAGGMGANGGYGGTGGGGGGGANSPVTADIENGGDAFNRGFFGRADPGGSPRSNSGGPGGAFTGAGGGGGGQDRNNSGTPKCHGPRHYNWPSNDLSAVSNFRDWHTAGGDGGSGIVVFKYELDAATDLEYTKATGGFTHKDSGGNVYHVFVGPTYAGPWSNPSTISNGATFAIPSPQSPFTAHVLMIGGGGGGGAADAPDKFSGGGGGAGLVLENSGYTFTSNSTCYINVGAGGEGCANYPDSFSTWGSGVAVMGDRTILVNPAGPYTHIAGGGGGGGIDNGPGGNPGEPAPAPWYGGSGGGGAGQNNPTSQYGTTAGKGGTGNTITDANGTGTWNSYANNGGAAAGPGVPSPGNAAGGGGGAGGAGSGASSDDGAAGGDSRAFPAIPDSIGVGYPGPTPGVAYFAGGGGGGSSGASTGGAGGGGGAGGLHPSSGGTSEAVRVLLTAKNGTGSGGGGGGTSTHTVGGPGSPGVVIIKYTSS